MGELVLWRFADIFAAFGHTQPQQERDACYRKIAEEAVQDWKEGRSEAFSRPSRASGPRLLREPEVLDIVETWWFQKFSGETGELRKTMAEHLARLGKEFAVQVSGSKGRLFAKREWRTVYEENKQFCQKFAKAVKAILKTWGRTANQNKELAKQFGVPEQEIASLRADMGSDRRTDWALRRAATQLGISTETLKSHLYR